VFRRPRKKRNYSREPQDPSPTPLTPAETDLSSAIPGACEEANNSMGWGTCEEIGEVEELRNLEPLCSARRETSRMRARKNVSSAVPTSSKRICQQSRLSLASSDTRSISSPRNPQGWFLHANDRNSLSVRNWLRHDPRTLKVSAWVTVLACQVEWVRWFGQGGKYPLSYLI